MKKVNFLIPNITILISFHKKNHPYKLLFLKRFQQQFINKYNFNAINKEK